MNAPQIISDIERKVKDALDVWAEWMEVDEEKNKLGYPSHSLVMLSGGGTWGSFVEDQEEEQENQLARAVYAIYVELPHPQQLAIDHFHLAAVWRSNRTNIEEDYADALMAIQCGLRKRGML